MERDAIIAFFLDRALAKSKALVHCLLFSRFPVQCSAIKKPLLEVFRVHLAIERAGLRVVRSCERSIASV